VSTARAEFDAREIKAVLQQYDIGAVEHVQMLERGSHRNPKAVITTSRGRYFLKRRTFRSDRVLRIGSAHRVQQHLLAQGFPAPAPIATNTDGDTLVVAHEAIYELFAFVAGGRFDYSPASATDAGRTLAMFHTLLDAYEPNWDPPTIGYHDNNGVRTSFAGLPSSVNGHDSVAGRQAELLGTIGALYDAYDTAAQAVEQLGAAQWRRQLVHGDWHPGNMLFEEDRVVAVVDYDSLHWLPAISDVANGALQFSLIGGPKDPLRWKPQADGPRLRGFLAGYETVRPLSEDETQALASLMIEALIAEAVLPVAATGAFGRIDGFRFLQMVQRKVVWLQQYGPEAVDLSAS
jgi:Ser/Thr protein kinase RdoA (MazF antagonist)